MIWPLSQRAGPARAAAGLGMCAGVDILHRCGSYAKCTTCRIEYLEGEPQKMTKAELEVLRNRNLPGQVRLSCQALCDHDMKVRVLMTVSSTGLDGPGPHPEE